jgi:prolipoprotein diacylglyceryltransferase
LNLLSSTEDEAMAPIDALTAGWYNVFYTAAITVAGAVTLRAGLQRGWRPRVWTMALLAWVAAGVVGAIIPGLVLGELAAARTAIGAIALATLALAVTARALRLPTLEALDTTAVAIPLGGAIVRIGCFIAECCQGVVTTLPVGVALHPGDELRHPVQLYEAALEALLAAVLWRRAGGRRPGVAIVTSIGGLAAIRFATEFLRDNEKFGHLSLAQWIAVPVVVVCALRLRARREGRPGNDWTVAFSRATLAVSALLLAGTAIDRRLPPLETATLAVAAIGVIVGLLARLRFIAPAGVTLMALQMPPLSADTTFPRRYNFFGLGATSGSYDARVQRGDCDNGTTADWTRHHSYEGLAIEAGSRVSSTATRANTFRARGYFGTERAGRAVVTVGAPSDPGGYSHGAFAVSLAGDFDRRYAGFTLGASLGQMYPAGSWDSVEPSEGVVFLPALGFRLGELHGPSLEVRVGDELPTWAPAPSLSAALGLGDSRGNRARIGVTDLGGLFVSGHYTNRGGFEIRPSIVVAPGGSDPLNLFQAGIMVRKWVRAELPPPVER